MKLAEEYCWAITQAAENYWCRSFSEVLEFGFQHDYLVHSLQIHFGTFIFNSNLRKIRRKWRNLRERNSCLNRGVGVPDIRCLLR